MVYPALNNQVPRSVVIGNSSRGPYTLQDVSGTSIRVRLGSHLELRRYSSTTDETGTALVLNTDYTINNTNVDSVTVTLTSAQEVLTSSQRLVIARKQTIPDVISLAQGANFSGPSLADAISVLTERQQELRKDVDRAVKVDWRETTERALPLPPTTASAYIYRATDGSIGQSVPIDISAADPSWDAALAAALGDGWTEAFADPYPETESGIIYASDYVTVGSTADQSVQMQAALDAAAGGTLILPKATIYCKALSLPGDTAIKGQEMDSSILKLPAAANTYLMASAGWITNTAYAEYGSVLEDFEIDGNSTNQSSAQPALVLKTYQARCSRLSVVLSKGDGLVFSAANSDGSLGATNNMANNIVDQCNIVLNERVGIHGIDHSSKLADWEIKNSNIWGNGRGYASGWNVYMERSAGGQFVDNQCYSPGDAGNIWLATAAGTRVIGNHIDLSGSQATSGTVIGLKMNFPTDGWGSGPVVANDIFINKATANGTETYQLAEFSSSTAGVKLSLVANNFRIIQNISGAVTWTSTGTLVTIDEGNSYINYAVQPTPSANVSRGLASNSAGTWTIDQALALNASMTLTGNLTQSVAGGASTFRYIAGESSSQTIAARFSADATGPNNTLQKARGTIASPSDVATSDEGGRRGYQMYASSAFREVARETVTMREATPSSSAMAVNKLTYLAADGSATMSLFMSEAYSVGLGLYGSTVIDADRGIRYPSYTSTALNAIANAINTTNKATGKTVYNSTAAKLVTAVGSTAGSVWVDGAGTTVNTPV